jgi:hypothetical protein
MSASAGKKKTPSLPLTSSGPPELNLDTFSLIHKAVAQRNKNRIEKLVGISPPSLEAKTEDKFRLTPLLLAAIYGYGEIFHLLVELGAKTQVKSSRGLDALQYALINNHYELVNSLLNHPKFSVLRQIFSTITLDNLKISELANSLHTLQRILLQQFVPLCRGAGGKEVEEEAVLKQFYEDMIKSARGIKKLLSLVTLCLKKEEMMERVAPVIAQILQSMCYSAELSTEMLDCSLPRYVISLMEVMNSSQGVQALIHINGTMVKKGATAEMMSLHACKTSLDAVKRVQNEEVTLSAVVSMLHCAGDPDSAENWSMDGVLEELVVMLQTPKTSNTIKSSIIQIFTKIARISEKFRQIVLKVKAVETLLTNLTKRSKLVMNIIDLLRVMCVLKGDTEEIIRQSKSATSTLVHVIQHSIDTDHKHKAFKILWLVVGDNTQKRRALAGLIGLESLIQMMDGACGDDLLTATTALCLVSPAIYEKQIDIVENGAVPLCLSAVRTASTITQVEALCVLEHCGHDIGFRPIEVTQEAMEFEGGIRQLLNLQTKNITVKLQALCAIASVSIGNLSMKKEIIRDVNFSFQKLIHWLATLDPKQDEHHLLLVTRCLCYLAYNSLFVQRMILLNRHTIPLRPYLELMCSEDRKTSTEAAFHTIILSRVLKERESHVEIVATCIKQLVTSLRASLEEEEKGNQIHVCSLISGLLHTRAGIMQAFIAINIIPLLVRVISSDDALCKKAAAVALSYITHDKLGCRIVLDWCRKDDKLYNTIVANREGYAISQDLVERWQRYKSVFILSQAKMRRSRLMHPVRRLQSK